MVGHFEKHRNLVILMSGSFTRMAFGGGRVLFNWEVFLEDVHGDAPSEDEIGERVDTSFYVVMCSIQD